LLFITGLQAAEIALIGILVSSTEIPPTALLLLAVALGIPTLFLTYIVYLRALDVQITSRRYIYAINMIRGYFVSQYPRVRGAITMPTTGNEPPIRSIGTGSSTLQSYAAIMLIMTVSLVVLLVGFITWLLFTAAHVESSVLPVEAIAAVIGVLWGGLASSALAWQMNRRLQRASVLLSKPRVR
jgi:hypothetical protein